MNKRWIGIAIAALMVVPVGNVDAQNRRRATAAGPESSLVNVALYDDGASIVRKFGSPDEFQAVTIGGGGGGGGTGGGPGASGGTQGPSGGAGAASANERSMAPAVPNRSLAENGLGIPNDDVTVRQFEDGGEEGRGRAGGGPPGRPGGGAPGGGGDGGGGAAQGVEATQFVRWVYRKPTVRYGFVLDRFNKVVQIEAIGLSDPKARTKKGVTFGDTFQKLMTAYGTPDGYEIAGDTIVVRFLDKNRVAFRLSRLKPNQKHQVVGIVVAAGKK